MAYKKGKRVYDKEALNVRANEIGMLQSKRDYKLATTIVGRLKDILRTDKSTIALAAPQIGYPYRIFCVRFSDGEIRGFVNPLIYKTSKDVHLSRERQLGHNSETEYIIPRCNEVEMSFQTPVGHLESNLFKDTMGEVVQQMDDLLNGVLLEDYGLEVIDGFDDASEEDKGEIIKMYLDHLQDEADAIKERLANDKEHAKCNEAMELMEQAKLGNVEMRFDKLPEKPKGGKPKGKKTKREIMADVAEVMKTERAS